MTEQELIIVIGLQIVIILMVVISYFKDRKVINRLKTRISDLEKIVKI